MKITRLHAIGCTRFSLNEQNQDLLYEPEEDIQIILGSNGSGKSTLVSYLLLTIPEKSDFKENGKLSIELTHNAKNYKLTYDFSSKTPYLFEVQNSEGEFINLNDSHKLTTQRELIAEHFFTSQHQSLILGQEKFTSMAPSKRRQWIVQMSETNYDLAVAVYEHLLKKHRDYRGAIKIAKERLVKEKSHLISDVEMQELKAYQDKLKNDIQLLLQNEPEINFTGKEKFNEILVKINSLNNRIGDAPDISHLPKNIKNYDQLQSEIASTKSVIETNESFSANITESCAKLEEEKKLLLIHLEAQSHKEEIAVLQEDIATRKAKIKYKLAFSNTSEVLNLFKSIKPKLLESIQALIPNPEGLYTPEKYKAARQQLVEDEGILYRRNNDVQSIQNKIDLLTQQELDHKVSCPNCHHTFIPGLAPNWKEELLIQLNYAQEQATKASETLSKTKTYLVDSDAYLEANRRFNELLTAFSQYPLIIEVLKNHPNRVSHPQGLFEAVIHLESDLENYDIIEGFESKIVEYLEAQKLTQKLSSTELAYFDKNIEQYNRQLEKLADHIFDAKKALATLQQAERTINLTMANGGAAKQVLDEVAYLWSDYQRITKLDFVKSVRKDLQLELEKVNYRIMQHLMSTKAVQVIEETIQESDTQLKHTKALVDALSPTKGLIAQGLTGFVNHFIEMVNTVIDSIWTYPLKLEAVVPSSNGFELDYYFPFTSGEELKHHKDVSDGSEGMKSVFDLAFQITALKNLDLLDYPLVLDEFGANLDRAHREKSSEMITKVMEELGFSQLFMISHFAATYGSFENANKFVLDATNIDR